MEVFLSLYHLRAIKEAKFLNILEDAPLLLLDNNNKMVHQLLLSLLYHPHLPWKENAAVTIMETRESAVNSDLR